MCDSSSLFPICVSMPAVTGAMILVVQGPFIVYNKQRVPEIYPQLLKFSSQCVSLLLTSCNIKFTVTNVILHPFFGFYSSYSSLNQHPTSSFLPLLITSYTSKISLELFRFFSRSSIQRLLKEWGGAKKDFPYLVYLTEQGVYQADNVLGKIGVRTFVLSVYQLLYFFLPFICFD